MSEKISLDSRVVNSVFSVVTVVIFIVGLPGVPAVACKCCFVENRFEVCLSAQQSSDYIRCGLPCHHRGYILRRHLRNTFPALRRANVADGRESSGIQLPEYIAACRSGRRSDLHKGLYRHGLKPQEGFHRIQ